MPDAVLPLLVGEDSGQTLEDIEVEFPSPAVEIEPPTKVVEIERCEAIPGKVIVVGRVIKSTWFAGNVRVRRDAVLPGDSRQPLLVTNICASMFAMDRTSLT